MSNPDVAPRSFEPQTLYVPDLLLVPASSQKTTDIANMFEITFVPEKESKVNDISFLSHVFALFILYLSGKDLVDESVCVDPLSESLTDTGNVPVRFDLT